jgi:hypothetical protein
MDQPTAEQALKEIEVLVGEWSQTATPAGGEPWPGEAKTTFEWLEGGQLLLERSTVEMPEAPDGVCVYGCDAANGTYYQLYTDDRNVCRVYQMSIGKGEWKLWREGEPFNQRFTATIREPQQDRGPLGVRRRRRLEDRFRPRLHPGALGSLDRPVGGDGPRL